ncbi:hypothetical protein [Palaeococcus ferrophilus]|uniref:hypothetical protein n=1 Tax=Palaeococcus ferrophilus TaxID=83868 RepID=UPI00064FD7C9|nr:hypothetical protein [Palaeococcus ferrophilus]
MKRLALLVVLIVLFSGCLSGTKVPTKDEILSSLEGADAYVYTVKITSPDSNDTVSIETGIDRKARLYFSHTLTEGNGTLEVWELYEGGKYYIKTHQVQGGKNLTNAAVFNLSDLYEALKPGLPPEVTEDNFEEYLLTEELGIQHDLSWLENATLTYTGKENDLYRFNISATVSYVSAPHTGNADYDTRMTSNVIKHYSGEMLVNAEFLPVKLEVNVDRLSLYKAANLTVAGSNVYEINVNYRFKLPDWAEELKKEAAKG